MSENLKPTESLKSQGAWLMFARTIGIAFSFILPVIIVRVLSQEDFGLYRQAFTVLTNAVTILSLGFAMSAFYYLSREEKHRASAVFNIILFHFVMGGLACGFLFFFPQFLGNIFRSDAMTKLAPNIGLTIWIWLFSLFLETVAIANKESRPSTFFIIFSQVSKTAFLVGAVIIFGTVTSILNAAIIQGLIQTAILLIYLNTRFPKFWTKFDWSFFREHLIYAVPFGLAATLWVLQQDIHKYFVGNRFSDAEFAIYAAGCAQLPFAAILVDSVGSVLIPKMSELQLKDDKREMIRIITRSMQKLAFFFFPIFVFLFLTAETFISTLYTRNYLAAVPIFLVNISLFPFFVIVSDPVIRSYEKLGRLLLFTRVFVFLGLISTLYFGLDYFGLIGMITAAVVAIVIEIFAGEAMVIYKLEVKLKDLLLLKKVGKTAVVSGLVGAITYAFYHFTKVYLFQFGENLVTAVFKAPKIAVVDFVSGCLILGCTFLVFAPLYLAISYMWNIIDDEEKQIVKKLFNKFLSLIGKQKPDSA